MPCALALARGPGWPRASAAPSGQRIRLATAVAGPTIIRWGAAQSFSLGKGFFLARGLQRARARALGGLAANASPATIAACHSTGRAYIGRTGGLYGAHGVLGEEGL